ncbi:protein kinase domain-containing protein [Frankia sp. CiP1_Cm_nod2]|uniref:protein kinase domain-containing protein n=1 Tax=Frankia sp. CiP1_Cm_nod2 TaxID=2897161 RepID=UPI0020245778
MSSALWAGPEQEPDAYQLIESLGAGGEGDVWRAVRPLSEGGAGSSVVAVKDFGPVIGATPDIERSWSRHVSLLQALKHPGIVRVFGGFLGAPRHWQGDVQPGVAPHRYLVMDYVEGTSLGQWLLTHGDADLSTRVRFVRQLATALDYLHSGKDTNGVPVAHGDVKPGNLLVQDDGSVILVDFGLANLADGTARLGMGSPGYIAPELLAAGNAARPTPDSDRYAFAATVVYLLTGQPPVHYPDASGWPRDVDRAATRAALAASPLLWNVLFLADLVLEGLAHEPGDRPRELARWLSGVGSQTITSSSLPPAPTSPGFGAGQPDRSTVIVPGPVGPGGPGGPGGPFGPGGPGIVPPPPVGRKPRVRMRVVVTLALAATIMLVAGAAVALPRLRDADKPAAGSVISGRGPGPASVSAAPLPQASASPSPSPSPTPSAAPTGGPMPSVVNVTLVQARQALIQNGVQVVVKEKLDPSATDNTVLVQDPPAGTRLEAGQQVTLTVARQPALVYLSDVRAVAGDPSTGSKTVNGKTYPHSLYTCTRRSSSFEFDLGRHYRTFQATAGIADDAWDSSIRILYEVFVDGSPAYRKDIGFGESVPISLDLTGVLRLKLTQTFVSGNKNGSCDYNVWGDARLLGVPSEVPTPTPGT